MEIAAEVRRTAVNPRIKPLSVATGKDAATVSRTAGWRINRNRHG